MIGNFVLSKKTSKANEVCLQTVHSFKGLENRIIILIDVDEQFLKDYALCYVALSRPRNHLIILGEQGALNKLVIGGSE
jgi:ATP-dependent exoDNAse (exonuclease V) beta subunit